MLITASPSLFPRKMSPIPHIAKLRIKIPNNTLINIEVTFDLMNCNISNAFPIQGNNTLLRQRYFCNIIRSDVMILQLAFN